MIPSEQWVEAVAKINELTQKGVLKWIAVPRQPATPFVSAMAGWFVVDYKGKRLRIRPFERTNLGIIESMARKSTTHVLEIIDDTGQQVWEFPDVAGIKDLYESVQFQQSGVKQFLDDLLKGP